MTTRVLLFLAAAVAMAASYRAGSPTPPGTHGWALFSFAVSAFDARRP